MFEVKLSTTVNGILIPLDVIYVEKNNHESVFLRMEKYMSDYNFFTDYKIISVRPWKINGTLTKIGYFTAAAITWYPKYNNLVSCLKYLQHNIERVVCGRIKLLDDDKFKGFYDFFKKIDEFKSADSIFHINYAITLNDIGKVKIISKHIGEIKQQYDKSPLSIAISSKNTDIFSYLMENKIFSVNHKNSFGMTPLHYAAEQNDVRSCSALIEEGADMMTTNYLNQTPLDLSSIYMHVESMNFLRSKMNTMLMARSLNKAAEDGNKDLVSKLVLAGTDINESYNGQTALHTAAYNRNIEMVVFLIKHGAKELKNSIGLMPSDMFRIANEPEILI